MNKLTLTFAAVLSSLASSYAGPMVSSGKESKSIVPAPTPCFGDHEFQLDLFGQYSVGEGPDHAGPFADHGWGGGVGLNYFFSRNIGIGVDAAWLYGKENAAVADVGSRGRHTTIHNFSGSVIFRMPIDDKCLAPYVYVGGGVAVDGEQWATAHAGVGVEYRVVPQKVGLFLDGRWTYYGDRFERGDQNNFATRAGVRVIF